MTNLSDFRFEVRRGSDLADAEQEATILHCTEAYEEDYRRALSF